MYTAQDDARASRGSLLALGIVEVDSPTPNLSATPPEAAQRHRTDVSDDQSSFRRGYGAFTRERSLTPPSRPISSTSRHSVAFHPRPQSRSQATLVVPSRSPYPDDSDSDDIVSGVSNSSFRPHYPLELDLHLQNNTAVEGGTLDGTVLLKVSKPRKNAQPLRIGPAKLRVIGFEAISSDRHTFYQFSQPLEVAAPSYRTLFPPAPDLAGFGTAREGQYTIPFSLRLPQSAGAKGTVIGRTSVSVRYIILVYVLGLFLCWTNLIEAFNPATGP